MDQTTIPSAIFSGGSRFEQHEATEQFRRIVSTSNTGFLLNQLQLIGKTRSLRTRSTHAALLAQMREKLHAVDFSDCCSRGHAAAAAAAERRPRALLVTPVRWYKSTAKLFHRAVGRNSKPYSCKPPTFLSGVYRIPDKYPGVIASPTQLQSGGIATTTAAATTTNPLPPHSLTPTPRQTLSLMSPVKYSRATFTLA